MIRTPVRLPALPAARTQCGRFARPAQRPAPAIRTRPRRGAISRARVSTCAQPAPARRVAVCLAQRAPSGLAVARGQERGSAAPHGAAGAPAGTRSAPKMTNNCYPAALCVSLSNEQQTFGIMQAHRFPCAITFRSPCVERRAAARCGGGTGWLRGTCAGMPDWPAARGTQRVRRGRPVGALASAQGHLHRSPAGPARRARRCDRCDSVRGTNQQTALRAAAVNATAPSTRDTHKRQLVPREVNARTVACSEQTFQQPGPPSTVPHNAPDAGPRVRVLRASC